MQCLNCGAIVEDEFCGRCGQKSATVRLSTSIILRQFLESVLHIRRGFPYTLKHLIINPGTSIRKYVEGGRIDWYKPLAFVMLTGLIAGFTMQMLEIEITNVNLNSGQGRMQEEFSKEINAFMLRNFSLIQLLNIPIYALFSYLWFIRSGFNYAENLILNGYSHGLVTGLSVIPWVMTTFVGPDDRAWIIGLWTFMAMAYVIVSYVRFFGSKNKWLAAIRGLVSYLCALLIVGVIAGVAGVIYVFSSDLMKDGMWKGMNHVHLEHGPDKVNTDRDIDVFLPSSYWENEEQHFPVIYMHDGQNLFHADSSYIGVDWMADEAMALRDFQDKETAIIVGISNTQNRFWDYVPEEPMDAFLEQYADSLGDKLDGMPEVGVLSDEYLEFITLQLKPWIDKRFRTRPEREHTSIAGSSMGGLISWYALCEYPTVFGSAACISTHWIGGKPETTWKPFDQFAAYLEANLPPPDSARIWFDYGTETLDAHYEPYQLRIDSLMRSKGFTEPDWVTMKYEGEEHSERSWQKRFPEILDFLLADEPSDR